MITSIVCERAGLPTGVFAHRDFVQEAYAIVKARSVVDHPLILLEDPLGREWGQIGREDFREMVAEKMDQVVTAIAPNDPAKLRAISVGEWARLYKIPV